MLVFTEKLYNVDEAVLVTMEEKHRILTDEVEKLEKESQTVIFFLSFPCILSLSWNELCTQLC